MLFFRNYRKYIVSIILFALLSFPLVLITGCSTGQKILGGAAALVGLAALTSGKSGGGNSSNTGDLPISADNQVQAQIKINLPQNCPLVLDQLKLATFFDETNLTSNGTGNIFINSNGWGANIVLEDLSENPILFAYILSDTNRNSTVSIGAKEIACGMIALNPTLIVFSPSIRDQIINKCTLHSQFPQLVSDIQSDLSTNPTKIFDPTIFPNLPILAFNIVKDVLTAGDGSTSSLRSLSVGLNDDPHIDDLVGPKVKWINPRMIGYNVEINNNGASLNRVGKPTIS
jgi:hypothetical protein